MVRTENIGTILMAKSASSGIRTRRIYIRYYIIRKNVEDGFIKILFVKTDDNDSNLVTKYVNKDTYGIHVVKFLGKIDG
jgi:hypothetical protein